MAEESVSPDPQALRALSHPVRMRMLGMLRVEGPSTSSRLAEQLGLNTGATSYHLRQLAQHGFIEEDADRGNQRERWWRARHQTTHVDLGPTEQEDRDVADAFAQAVVMVHHQTLQRAVEERSSLPDEWRRAVTASDWILRLTPEQAERLIERLAEIFDEVRGTTPDPTDETTGTHNVMFQLHAFPYPGFAPSHGRTEHPDPDHAPDRAADADSAEEHDS